MVLQVVSMWMIVMAAFFWFARDERRRYEARLDAGARQFAARPFRRAAAEPPLTPITVPAGQYSPSPTHRAFVRALQQASREH